MKIKLLPTYYLIALIYGIYNIYANINTTTSLLESAQAGFNPWDIVTGSFFFFLLITGGIMIFRVYKKKYHKLNLIYPIYWYSILLFLILFDLFFIWYLGGYGWINLMDTLHPWYNVIYFFDILIPLFVLYKNYPDIFSKILKNIRDFFYI